MIEVPEKGRDTTGKGRAIGPPGNDLGSGRVSYPFFAGSKSLATDPIRPISSVAVDILSGGCEHDRRREERANERKASAERSGADDPRRAREVAPEGFR
jgi:hypothetical protein